MQGLFPLRSKPAPGDAGCSTGLACEEPLRVAAAMLSRAAPGDVGAATVVGVVGLDDLGAFRALVGEIAETYGLAAAAELSVGSFSVRLIRRSAPEPEAEAPRPEARSSLLASLRAWLARPAGTESCSPQQPAVTGSATPPVSTRDTPRQPHPRRRG